MTTPTPHERALEAAAKAVPREGIGNHATEGCDCPSCQECRALTQKAVEPVIQAYRAAMAEAGWKMVPRLPTDLMHGKGFDARMSGCWTDMTWQAMYDAAPAPDREG